MSSGFSYFYVWENVDSEACDKCQYFELNKKNFKYYCNSKGQGFDRKEKMRDTSMECSEWNVNKTVDEEVAEKSKGKGFVEKMAAKAGGELKKAALKDLNTMGRNLGKLI